MLEHKLESYQVELISKNQHNQGMVMVLDNPVNRQLKESGKITCQNINMIELPFKMFVNDFNDFKKI